MDIQHASPTELLVKFRSNPGAMEAAAWADMIKSALTGEEKSAVVDLRGLDVISSLGVNVIVGLFKNIEKQGGGISVQVPNERMAHVFELFRLNELFDIQVVRP